MIEVHELDQRQHRHRVEEVHPEHAPGCLVSAPSFMIGTDDVFEARKRASGSSSSSRRNIVPLERLVLDHRLDRGVGALDVVERRRERRGARAPHSGRPRSACPPRTPRSSDCSIDARVRSARASSTSTTVTSTPERAQTSAIPEPMRPPPMTPTRMGRDASTRRDRGSARPRRGRRQRAARSATPPSAARGITQTQLGSLLDPGRTIRPTPRSAAALRATSAASSRSSSCCATGVSAPCASM